jgi:hypothetical protein
LSEGADPLAAIQDISNLFVFDAAQVNAFLELGEVNGSTRKFSIPLVFMNCLGFLFLDQVENLILVLSALVSVSGPDIARLTHWLYLLIANRVIGRRLSRDDVRYVCSHFIKLDVEALSVCVALLRLDTGE